MMAKTRKRSLPARRRAAPLPPRRPLLLPILVGSAVLLLGGGIAWAAARRGGWQDCTLTCYFPGDRKHLRREGGPLDRRDQPAYTLQAFLRGEAPYVSISGDPALFKYGTPIQVEYLDTLAAGQKVDARVVDTGDHFRGATKVYLYSGSEPLDVACDVGQGFGRVRSRYRVTGPPIAHPRPQVA